MKIILFFGEFTPQGEALFNHLKAKGFFCVRAKLADEVLQLGNQSKKVAVVFQDLKLALPFFSENTWGDFSIYKVLYVAGKPTRVSPDLEKKMNALDLNLYYPGIVAELEKKLGDFYSGNSIHSGDDIEIEFAVHEQIKGKE